MCESCQKGRLQVGKLDCCTFKNWRELTCPFYVFTRNEFEFEISRFFDHFTTIYKSCLFQLLLILFSSKKFDCFKSSWKHGVHTSALLSKNGGYVLVLSSYSKDLKYLLNVDLHFIQSRILQIFDNFEKKWLYLLLIFELDHWPNFVVYIAIKPITR